MQREVKRQIVTVVSIVVAILVMGVLLGMLYGALPSNNPQKSQAGCESVGGDWDAVASTCLVSYKSAGESCTDGGQCKSGVCSPPILSNEDDALLARGPLSGVVGICATTAEVFGCVPQVLKGTISIESMCIE